MKFMIYVFFIVYLVIITYGTYWLITQTGSYWWVLLWFVCLPNIKYID